MPRKPTTSTQKPPEDPASTRPGPGRPRLTPEDLHVRVVEYCRRYDVSASDDQALPPFPSGKRETRQHREWMSLYKAHRRVNGRAQAGSQDSTKIQELLTAQRTRCPICRKPIDPAEAHLDQRGADPAVVHSRCLELLMLARELGPEALERARGRI